MESFKEKETKLEGNQNLIKIYIQINPFRSFSVPTTTMNHLYHIASSISLDRNLEKRVIDLNIIVFTFSIKQKK